MKTEPGEDPFSKEALCEFLLSMPKISEEHGWGDILLWLACAHNGVWVRGPINTIVTDAEIS